MGAVLAGLCCAVFGNDVRLVAVAPGHTGRETISRLSLGLGSFLSPDHALVDRGPDNVAAPSLAGGLVGWLLPLVVDA